MTSEARAMCRGAVVALVLLGGCALLGPKDPARAVRGIYNARLPAADSAGRIVTLWVQPGGAATLETVFVGKPERFVEEGTWSYRDERLRIVLGDTRREASTTLVYRLEDDRLVPQEWDRTRYGETGLPLRRR
jgi:hypothetical protein